MKKRRKLTKLIALILTVCFMFGQMPQAVSTTFAANSLVELTVIDDQKAEIAFAVGDTMMDYSRFEQDLLAELDQRGISDDRVNFLQFDATSSTTQNTFEWWTYDHANTDGLVTTNETTHTYIDKNTSSTSIGNNYDQTDFATGTTPATSNTHILTTNNGATMDFYGYGSQGYKDFQYLPNTQATKKTIQFTINEGSAYDALDGVGFLVNTSITGDTYANQVINGYLIFLQYSYDGIGTNIKLFSLNNVSANALHSNMSSNTFDYSIPAGATLLATASTTYGNYKYRKIKIEIMPSYIKMWYNGSATDNVNVALADSDLVRWTYNSNTVTEYPITKQFDSVGGKNIFRGGYGPLISYRSHSCNRLTHFTLSNLSMTSEYVRSLTEIVREPSWDDNKASFLVNLNESPIEDFSDQYTTSEIINRLGDDDITYIGWGSNENSAGSAPFVEAVGNHSGFVNIDDYGTTNDRYSNSSQEYRDQITALATCVVERLAKEPVEGNSYRFLDTDRFRFTAVGATLDDGLWSVGYSDTEDGEKAISTYQDLRNASFGQTGWYEIYYDSDTEDPKAYIRIHKAPLALATATINTNASPHTISVDTSQSYDPDYPDAENNGIVSTVVEYRNVTDGASAAWTTTAPDSIDPDETWMVKVTVTDSEGATDSIVKSVIETAGDVAPYGSFKLSSNTYYDGIDANVVLYDQSYALDGDNTGITLDYEIVNNATSAVVWSSSTVGNTVEAGATKNIPLNTLAAGNYTISLVAKKGAATAPKVSRTFRVVVAHEVSYDINGGTGTIAHQYKIQDADLTLSSIAPSRTGYTFAGWQGSDNNVYQPGATYSTDATLTLTAIWEANFVYSAEGVSVDYDGQPHSIGVTVTNPETGAVIYYGTSSTSITSTDNIQKTDAGTYPVYFKLTSPGYHDVVNSRSIVIRKGTLTLTLDNQTKRYTGNPVSSDSVEVSGVIEGEEDDVNGHITYLYFTDADCTVPTTAENSGAEAEHGAPANEGVYYVKASYPSTTNYNTAESNVATLTVEKYTVHFNANNVVAAPDDITGVVPGTTVASPGELAHDDYIFLGWYKSATGDEVWNFDTDTVERNNTTIYAHWKAKSAYEVRYTDPDNPDEWIYGTLEEALNLEPVPTEIVIQNDVQWPEAVDDPEDPDYPKNNSVPEGTTIIINPGVTVTNDENIDVDGVIENNGTLDNDGTITGDGTLDNNGNVDNEDGIIDLGQTNNNGPDGTISGGTINGDVDNDGVIDGATLTGDVDNDGGELIDSTIGENGTVTGGDIEGDTVNNGTITGSTLHDDVDNTNGYIDDSTIDNGGTVTGGDVSDVTINGGGILEDANVDGDIDNDGSMINCNIKGDVDNEGGDVIGGTLNDGANITGGDVSDTTIDEGAVVEDANVGGDVDNNGTIKNSNIIGNVDNSDGEIEGGTIDDGGDVDGGGVKDVTINEGGTLENADVDGDVSNEGSMINCNIKGKVDNTNGEMIGGIISEDAEVVGGSIDGNVENNGSISGSSVIGVVTNEGVISGSDISGQVDNNGLISKSDISGVIDNIHGTIDGGTLEEKAVIIGGDFDGEIVDRVDKGDEELKVMNVGEQTIELGFADSVASVLGIVLSDNEKTLVEYGSDVIIFVTVENADKIVKESEKQLLSTLLTGDQKIGMYLDINLYKQITGYDPVQITDTNGNLLSFTIKIPKELVNTDSSVERTYQLFRIHDGKVEVLTGTYNSADQTYTFKSDKFSIFAIAYVDKKIETTVTEPKLDKSADTGDHAPIAIVVMLMLDSGLGALYLTLRRYL